MISKRELKKLAKQHGTPLFVIDHDELRRNREVRRLWEAAGCQVGE